MQEMIKLLIGVFILALGFPIGNLLSRLTKEEMKSGRIWFKLIVYISLTIGIIGLTLGSDWLMFTMFFIAIVTSRSLKK